MFQAIYPSEANLVPRAPNPIVLGANGVAILLVNERGVRGHVAKRFIQNCGANRLYYSIGIDGGKDAGGNTLPRCDGAGDFNGYLEAGQQLDCSSHRAIVCGFSVLGTTVGITIFDRANDSVQAGPLA